MTRKVRGSARAAVVPGAHVVRNNLGAMLYAGKIKVHPNMASPCSTGDPIWNKGKQQGAKLQFRNAAGKRRALAAYNTATGSNETDVNKVDNLVLYALKDDLVKVPIYRGFDPEFAREVQKGIERDRERQRVLKALENQIGTGEAVKTIDQPTEQSQ